MDDYQNGHDDHRPVGLEVLRNPISANSASIATTSGPMMREMMSIASIPTILTIFEAFLSRNRGDGPGQTSRDGDQVLLLLSEHDSGCHEPRTRRQGEGDHHTRNIFAVVSARLKSEDDL